MKAIIVSLLAMATWVSGLAQTKPSPNWDNQAYIGNKVATNKGDWRFSGELQVRLKNDLQGLDNWFIGGVATYMLSKNGESHLILE